MLKLKLKDSEPRPVKIKLKANRNQVEGYDAEAPDREEDPTVEEAMILRLLPNIKTVEQLHKACETNDFSQVSIKFEERRKAIVTIANESYHAQLMDLPTITEIHKTVDKRNIFKTVSVSQILLVTHNVKSPPPDMSAIARLAPDPQSYPHGITPPLHNVRNRRFQKRMSNKAIESIESQVEELLKRDAQAKEVQTELLPASAVAAQQALAEAARAAARARVEESDMEVDDELDEELERAMLDDSQDEKDKDGTPGQSSVNGDANGQNMNSSSDDDDDDDDDDDERNPDDDDDDDARQDGKRLREEVRELQTTIEAKERVARTVVNDIMKARHMDAVNRLRSELDKKISLLNEADANSKAPEVEEEEEEEDEEDDDDEEDDAPNQQDQMESQQLPEQPEMPAQQEEPDQQEQFAGLGERLEDALRVDAREEDDDIDSLF